MTLDEAFDVLATILDEGARNKYVDMMDAKAQALKAETEKQREQYKDAVQKHGEDSKEARSILHQNIDAREKLTDEMTPYINGFSLTDGWQPWNEKRRSKVYSNKNNHIGDASRRKGNERFKKDFGGPEKPGKNDINKKINARSVNASADMLREACLTILAALDEE